MKMRKDAKKKEAVISTSNEENKGYPPFWFSGGVCRSENTALRIKNKKRTQENEKNGEEEGNVLK